MSDEKKEKPEEEILAEYMDGVGANGETPTDEDRKKYWHSCYENVKRSYKGLLISREDIDGMPKSRQDQAKTQLVEQFRINRQDRFHVVKELRKLGEKVDDNFVPLSAV